MRIACLSACLALLCCPIPSSAQPALDELVRDLQSEAVALRAHAAASLGQRGDFAAVPPLIAALQDPARQVRRAAAGALGQLRDARATTALMAALSDRDPNVRFQAAYALGEIKSAASADALLGSLSDADWNVRDQAAWALREVNDRRIVGSLVAMLRQPECDTDHIAWLLRHFGHDAIGPIAAILKDSAVPARLRAVEALDQIDDAAVVAPLTAAIADADASVRRRAVEALLGREDDSIEGALRNLLAREVDPAVRALIEEGLKRLSPADELHAYWSFDDDSATVAKDVTGHGNDGQIKDCEVVEGKVGKALRFGPKHYVSIGKPPAIPMNARPLTVMAWVKDEAPNGVVVSRGGAFCGFSLYVKDGIPKFGIRRGQANPAEIAATQEPIGRDWTHLAGVIREDRIELYVNGKLAASKSAGYIPGNCGQGMEIGTDLGSSPAEIMDSFQGVIDEVKVVAGALSEKQIARLANP